MARVYLFADETGNFDVVRRPGATRYFGVGTVLLDAQGIRTVRVGLHALRGSLAWRLRHPNGGTHASLDPWPVRSAVLRLIAAHELRVDATLLDKWRTGVPGMWSDTALYEATWTEHLSRVMPEVCGPGEEVMIVAADLGTRQRRAQFRAAVERSLAACGVSLGRTLVVFWPAVSDPCLWAADYCAWAVGRWWEHGDRRAYSVIAHRVGSARTMSGGQMQCAPPD